MGESLPSQGLYVDNALKSLFKSTIQQLISDLGRTVTLYFAPTASGCANCGIGPDGSSNGIYNASNPFALNGKYHKAFPNGSPCPVCKGSHKILTAKTATYTATISRAPRDLDYDVIGLNPSNVYATKMVLDAFDDLYRCEKILIDGEYCVRIRDPIKTGMKDLSFVRCWWKKMT